MGLNTGRSPNRTTPRRTTRKRARHRMRRFEGVLAQLPSVQWDWRTALQGVQAPDLLLPTPWTWSKLLSGLFLAAALSALTLLHWEDRWYLYNDRISHNPLARLTPSELFQVAAVDGWNIFWIEPEEVRTRLLAHRWIRDAQVDVALPAAMHIHIAEREPVALWQTGAGVYWVADDGATLPVATDEEIGQSSLPRIVDVLGEAETRLGEPSTRTMDPQILQTALTLIQAMPELDGQIRYNRGIGLNFPLLDPAVWVYWGDGQAMEAKLENLAASRKLLAEGETTAQILDVRFAARPYIR